MINKVSLLINKATLSISKVSLLASCKFSLLCVISQRIKIMTIFVLVWLAGLTSEKQKWLQTFHL